jgi:TonB family protein
VIVEDGATSSHPRTRDRRGVALLWALVASTVVHSALVALPRTVPGRGANLLPDHGVALQAVLAAPEDQQPDTTADRQPVVAPIEAPSPLQIAARDVPATPDVPPVPTGVLAHPPPATPPLLGVGGFGEVNVDGVLLADKDRLGEALSRQMSEFPVEVDFPVRMNEAIRAQYPPAALAAGREDSVAVWIVVDAQGVPEEVLVTDGQEEFAAAVIAAVRSAHFVPARNNLVPIRFPLALEFRFVIGARDATAVSR